jgi:hypothetical protein
MKPQWGGHAAHLIKISNLHTTGVVTTLDTIFTQVPNLLRSSPYPPQTQPYHNITPLHNHTIISHHYTTIP